MTALIIAYYVLSSIFYAGVALVDPTGAIQSVGLSPAATFASNSPTDIRDGIANAAIGYASTQGYTITASDVLSEVNSMARSFATTTRSLNTAFQISSTRDAFISCPITASPTLTLTSGQTATVTSQYADNSTMTTNVQTLPGFTDGNTGVLALGAGLSQTVGTSIGGFVPAGKWLKFTTSGAATPTLGNCQEVLQ